MLMRSMQAPSGQCKSDPKLHCKTRSSTPFAISIFSLTDAKCTTAAFISETDTIGSHQTLRHMRSARQCGCVTCESTLSWPHQLALIGDPEPATTRQHVRRDASVRTMLASIRHVRRGRVLRISVRESILRALKDTLSVR